MSDHKGGHDAVDGATGGEDGQGRGEDGGVGHLPSTGDGQHARGDRPHARRGQGASDQAAGEHSMRSAGGVRRPPPGLQGDRLRRGWIPARALLCLMGDLERARLAMADEGSKRSLIEHFSALDDPRQAWKVIYPLPEIMLLVLCATLAGAEDFVEARLWGVKNLAFLRRFLPFAEGIPSHDTLNDVVNALDPALFKTCFVTWVEGLREAEPDIVAIDGKTSRRTHNRAKGREPLHLVSAWAAPSAWC